MITIESTSRPERNINIIFVSNGEMEGRVGLRWYFYDLCFVSIIKLPCYLEYMDSSAFRLRREKRGLVFVWQRVNMI